MKKLILAALLLPTLAMAQSQTVPTTTETKAFVRPFCMFGMQFIVTTIENRHSNAASSGVAVVQVMESAGNNKFPPQPMKCEKNG